MNDFLAQFFKKRTTTAENFDNKGIVVNDIIKMLTFAENLSKLTIGYERSRVQIEIGSFQTSLVIVKGRQKANNLFIYFFL